MEFSAFLMQANPGTLSLLIIIFDIHRDGGGDAGEAVTHECDECAIAKADGVSPDTPW